MLKLFNIYLGYMRYETAAPNYNCFSFSRFICTELFVCVFYPLASILIKYKFVCIIW